jgi:hypothetical protein
MVYKPLLDNICKINNTTSPIYPLLPIIYTILTILFIVLGIIGIIAFAYGNKFKNWARNIYGFVHFTTTFLCMLFIFSITYCSLVIPYNPEAMKKILAKFDYSKFTRKTKKPEMESAADPGENKIGGTPDTPDTPEDKLKANMFKIIAKVFAFINNLLENNTIPIIFIQILCTSIIVIICTFMSSIFSGISKAGYEMHCVDSDQVFGIPFFGILVDFLMYLFLFISSFALIFYIIIKMAKDGFNAVSSGFGLKSGNTTPMSTQEVMDSTGDYIWHPDVQQYFIELNYVMNEWPIMRATFVITFSYYLSQLVLRWFEDLISSNIVSLVNWQKKKTECSDEEDKERKTSMDRSFTLFGHIVLFIILVIIIIILIAVYILNFPIIREAIGELPNIYTPAVATISLPLTYESVKETISKVSKGKVNVEKMENQLFRELSKVTNNNGELDVNFISNIVEEIKKINLSQSLWSKPTIITKSKKVPNPMEQSNDGTNKNSMSTASPPSASPPVASPPSASPPVASPPVASPPVASPPVASPPVASPPVASPPLASPPGAQDPYLIPKDFITNP